MGQRGHLQEARRRGPVALRSRVGRGGRRGRGVGSERGRLGARGRRPAGRRRRGQRGGDALQVPDVDAAAAAGARPLRDAADRRPPVEDRASRGGAAAARQRHLHRDDARLEGDRHSGWTLRVQARWQGPLHGGPGGVAGGGDEARNLGDLRGGAGSLGVSPRQRRRGARPAEPPHRGTRRGRLRCRASGAERRRWQRRCGKGLAGGRRAYPLSRGERAAGRRGGGKAFGGAARWRRHLHARRGLRRRRRDPSAYSRQEGGAHRGGLPILGPHGGGARWHRRLPALALRDVQVHALLRAAPGGLAHAGQWRDARRRADGRADPGHRLLPQAVRDHDKPESVQRGLPLPHRGPLPPPRDRAGWQAPGPAAGRGPEEDPQEGPDHPAAAARAVVHPREVRDRFLAGRVRPGVGSRLRVGPHESGQHVHGQHHRGVSARKQRGFGCAHGHAARSPRGVVPASEVALGRRAIAAPRPLADAQPGARGGCRGIRPHACRELHVPAPVALTPERHECAREVAVGSRRPEGVRRRDCHRRRRGEGARRHGRLQLRCLGGGARGPLQGCLGAGDRGAHAEVDAVYGRVATRPPGEGRALVRPIEVDDHFQAQKKRALHIQVPCSCGGRYQRRCHLPWAGQLRRGGRLY
mmetsp:Transcript_129089/g.373574  ORF Transcript_129089/g.373574 Transcript_129089/m.373574 type:complete len:640 (+) Transcript_129089:1378-3297(+)